MKINKIFAIAFAFICLLGTSANVKAQESSTLSMTVGADVTNKYLWRGMELAKGSFQPSAYLNYEKGDWAVSVGAWGTKAFKKDEFNELDLSAELSWKNLTFSVTNYREYYGSEFDDNYLDLGLSWTLSENIPLTLSWYSIVNQTNCPSYLELSYEQSVSVIDLRAAVGILPFKAPDYYGNDKFEVCNLNLSAGHEFELNDKMSIPVSAQMMYNPMLEDFYWSVSGGFYFTFDLKK